MQTRGDNMKNKSTTLTNCLKINRILGLQTDLLRFTHFAVQLTHLGAILQQGVITQCVSDGLDDLHAQM